MKKVSTAATIESRNISQQKLTIGLDLGDGNSWYCVLDETGKIELEQRVRFTLRGIRFRTAERRASAANIQGLNAFDSVYTAVRGKPFAAR